ncbi:MAG: DUF447 family protein, partial [Planctomycetes bacterium]|nr:DUF447 family protein [Planctomycetota bacterium]
MSEHPDRSGYPQNQGEITHHPPPIIAHSSLILEGIVTSQNGAGLVNIAPMGPRVEDPLQRFVLRPYQSSTTYRNLKQHGEGVLHVTDDVWLLARAAIGSVEPVPE